MDSLSFTNEVWNEYLEWQGTDQKIFKRINILIKDIQRNEMLEGIGKPEVLKTQKAYSRRIDEYHRLVCTGDEHQNLKIVSCRGHYED
jgi:toxin YoeB